MKFSIMENDRTLRGIVFKLPVASQVPYEAKINKPLYIITLMIFILFSYFPA